MTAGDQATDGGRRLPLRSTSGGPTLIQPRSASPGQPAMRSRSSSTGPSSAPLASCLMRSIIRLRIAHSSGSRLPGVRCSTEMKTSRGSSPYAICAGLPGSLAARCPTRSCHWLRPPRGQPAAVRIFADEPLQAVQQDSLIAPSATCGPYSLVGSSHSSFTHTSFPRCSVHVPKRYGWYGTGVYSDPVVRTIRAPTLGPPASVRHTHERGPWI